MNVRFLLLFFLLIVQLELFGQVNNTLQFVPLYNGEEIELEKNFIVKDSNWIKFSSCRFYLSNFNFYYHNELIQTDNSIFLLDLENPTSLLPDFKPCVYDKVTFSIGIDSITNVSGILDGVLDPINGMYWAWNSGYINFKLEGKSSLSTNVDKSFEYHLGGYLPPYTTIQSVEISWLGFNSDRKIEIELATFLANVDLVNKNTLMIPGKEAAAISKILPTLFTIERSEK